MDEGETEDVDEDERTGRQTTCKGRPRRKHEVFLEDLETKLMTDYDRENIEWRTRTEDSSMRTPSYIK